MAPHQPPIDSASFRQLCGRFATGVVVITAIDDDGRPAGMTLNSFASVSLEPPLVSINIDRAAGFHGLISRIEKFAINVLDSGQEEVSRRFAGPAPERFDGIGYHETDIGCVVLEGTVAVIECERFEAFDVGDHTIVIGHVVGGQAREGQPLLFYRGGYRTLE